MKYNRFIDDIDNFLNGKEYLILVDYRERQTEDYEKFLNEIYQFWVCGKSLKKIRQLENVLRDLSFIRRDLTEGFLREYSDYLNWNIICQFQHLSESFMHDFRDKLEWYHICQNQILSEKFIRQHVDYLDESCWAAISEHIENNLSESFIREFKDFVQWDFIVECQCPSKNFVREFARLMGYNNFDRGNKNMTQEETLEFKLQLTDSTEGIYKVGDVIFK